MNQSDRMWGGGGPFFKSKNQSRGKYRRNALLVGYLGKNNSINDNRTSSLKNLSKTKQQNTFRTRSKYYDTAYIT